MHLTVFVRNFFLAFGYLKTFWTFLEMMPLCLFVTFRDSLLSLFPNEEHNHPLTDSGFSPHARPLSGDTADPTDLL